MSFGGIQFASNFSTRPEFVSYPTPSLTGEATIPTTVDLFIDNARVFHSNTSPGPFSIDHVPVVTGEGQAQVVTKDILGREQLISIPFYVSSSLLKQGLHEFSYEAGLTREDYGTASDHYNRWLVVGSERYGMTDHLTTGMHVEVQKQLRTLGVSATVLPYRLGTVSTTVAGSHHDHFGHGGMVQLGVKSNHHRLDVSASTQLSTKHFTQLGLQLDEVEPDMINRAFLGWSINGKNSVGLSYLGEFGKGFSDVNLFTLNYRSNVAKDWHFMISGVINVGAFISVSRQFNLYPW